MLLLRSFPVVCFSLVLLSIVGLGVAQRSLVLLVVAGALAAVSWTVTEGPRGRQLPRPVASLLVIVLTLLVMADLAANHRPMIEVLGGFAVGMTLVKLYEPKGRRDHAQLLLLSLLLMVIGSVQTTELLFGALLVTYALLGLYALLLYQLHAAHEEAGERRRLRRPRGVRGVPGVKPIIGRHVPLQFRLLTTGIALAGVVLSVLVFLIFPRDLGREMVPALPTAARGERTGLAESIDLQAGSRITESRRPVLELRLRDPAGGPVTLEEPLRLRAAVLVHYEGDGQWRAGKGNSILLDLEDGAMRELAVAAPVEPVWIEQDVTLFARSGPLPCADAPIAVAVDGGGTIALDRGSLLLHDAEPGGIARYRVRSAPGAGAATRAALHEGVTSPGGRRSELLDEAVALLARDVLERAGVPAQRPRARSDRWAWYAAAADALSRHLQGGGYVYDLDLSDVVISGAAPEDPVSRFLLETRRGHCEYFASGLASLCENVGVPSRIVTGYVAWQYDEVDDRYVVLESNAHAWVEVRTGPMQWTAFDPTPPATLRQVHESETTLADRLNWFYQRFESTWNAGVVAYDGRVQGRLTGTLALGWSDRLARTMQGLRDRASRVNRAFYFGPAGYIWMGVVAFAATLAILVVVRISRRRRRLRRVLGVGGAAARSLLGQVGFYVDMLDVLERAGCGKPAWRPPLAHARALAAERPEVAAIVGELTDRFYAARYGGRRLTADDRAAADRQLERLRAAVRGTT